MDINLLLIEILWRYWEILLYILFCPNNVWKQLLFWKRLLRWVWTRKLNWIIRNFRCPTKFGLLLNNVFLRQKDVARYFQRQNSIFITRNITRNLQDSGKQKSFWAFRYSLTKKLSRIIKLQCILRFLDQDLWSELVLWTVFGSLKIHRSGTGRSKKNGKFISHENLYLQKIIGNCTLNFGFFWSICYRSGATTSVIAKIFYHFQYPVTFNGHFAQTFHWYYRYEYPIIISEYESWGYEYFSIFDSIGPILYMKFFAYPICGLSLDLWMNFYVMKNPQIEGYTVFIFAHTNINLTWKVSKEWYDRSLSVFIRKEHSKGFLKSLKLNEH